MITPNMWGPHYWTFFHLLSIKYPDNSGHIDRAMMIELINSIVYILPCSTCTRHFKKNLKDFPIENEDLESKETLISWFIDFHNVVNISLNKRVLSKTSALDRVYSIHSSYYIDYLDKVLSYIEYDLNDRISNEKCKGIQQFVKGAIHFCGKKIDKSEIKFKDYSSFRVMRKNLIKKLNSKI